MFRKVEESSLILIEGSIVEAFTGNSVCIYFCYMYQPALDVLYILYYVHTYISMYIYNKKWLSRGHVVCPQYSVFVFCSLLCKHVYMQKHIENVYVCIYITTYERSYTFIYTFCLRNLFCQSRCLRC